MIGMFFSVTIRCTIVFGIATSSAISLTFKCRFRSRTVLITVTFSSVPDVEDRLECRSSSTASFHLEGFAPPENFGMMTMQLFHTLSSTFLMFLKLFFQVSHKI